MRVVYEYLVETCMGILKDDLQLPFNVLERLEHPELHERSFPNFILFRHTCVYRCSTRYVFMWRFRIQLCRLFFKY